MDNVFLEVLENGEVINMDVLEDLVVSANLEMADLNTADETTFVGYKAYPTSTVQRALENVIDRKQEKIELDNAIDYATWVENQLV